MVCQCILASVVNASFGTWRMLMHEKPYLIPIMTRYISTVVQIK